MKPEVIESERLIFKPLNTTYTSQAYLDWINDEEVNRFLETKGSYTIQMLNEYLEKVEGSKTFFWAIIIKSTNKHIGNIKIDPIDWRNSIGEYGIVLGDKDSRGKGYGKEASQAIINYCFSNLELRKITLGVVEDNTSALNLYKKLGFIQEGFLKSHAYHIGKWRNVIRMAIFNPQLK